MTTNEQHDRYMQQRYGLLPGQYRQMLDEQGGRCFICGGRPRSDRRLVLDHDHQTGEPRGLLCGACNTFLARAETYLGRREPDGMWPRPPSHGLWVNGELWTWRPRRADDLDPDEYRAMDYQGSWDHSHFPWWMPRWQLTPPWRLQPPPAHVVEQRQRREARQSAPSPFDHLPGQDRPPPMIAGAPAPHDRPADTAPGRELAPPPAPRVRRHRAGSDHDHEEAP